MSDDERSKLTDAIYNSQKQMFERLSQEEPDWMTADLTMPQFKILHLLYGHGAMRMSALAKVLGKNISTATGIVDNLVEARFIQRQEDPEDRRAVVVGLTEKGSSLCESFEQQGWHTLRRLLARMNNEELQIVLQSFELFGRAAKAEAESSSKQGLEARIDRIN